MAQPERRPTPEERVFRRKVARSRWALYFERLWPRLWSIIAIAGLFILVSMFGLWPLMSEQVHWAVLGAFAVAIAVAFVFVILTPRPTHNDAIRRLEARSATSHRPASTYEDTLSSARPGGTTDAIWQAHRERLRKDIAKLHVAAPVPRTDRFDRIGLRAALMTVVVAALGLVGDASFDRLQAAFRIVTIGDVSGVRLDAWVTPPPILDARRSSLRMALQCCGSKTKQLRQARSRYRKKAPSLCV